MAQQQSIFENLSIEGWVSLGSLAVLLLLAVVGSAIHLGLPVLRAKALGLEMSFQAAIGMLLRRVNPNLIVKGLRHARKHGVRVTHDQLEVHVLAGGDMLGVVRAMCRAKELGKPSDWDTIASIDLAEVDVERVVESDFDLRTFLGGPDPGDRKAAYRKRGRT